MSIDNSWMNHPSSSSNTPAPTPPPFGSPAQGSNPYFNPNDNEFRFMNPHASSYVQHSQHQQHQQQQGYQISLFAGGSQYIGQPMHNMASLNQINSYAFHQRSSSYPAPAPAPAPAPPLAPALAAQGPLPNFASGTVNPRLLSSPPLESQSQWNQSTFGVQSPFNGARSLAQAQAQAQQHQHQQHQQPSSLPSTSRLNSDIQYAALYTSLDGPFDQLGRPSNPIAFKEPKTASLSGDQSNETSLLPDSSSSLVSKPRSDAPPSDISSAPPQAARGIKTTRQVQSRRTPARPTKRPRRSDPEVSDDDDDSDDDDGPTRSGGVKYHKACSNCRKQKGKCVKRDTDDKCRMCRTRNLQCVFEPRPERKQPVQRKVLLEQIRRKDAIIESFRQMLKPHMLQHLHSGSENNPSSGSPPSSAAHEEPLRKQVLEWLEKAEASKVSTGSFNLDSRAFNDSSSEDNDEPVDKFNSNPSSLSRPPLNQPHSYRYSTSSGGGGDGVDLSRRSRSPRMMRSSAIHPVELLARASLRGSGMGSRPSSVGEPLPSTASPAEIGVARHDYFVSGDSMAKRASQLGLRKIEIDRGLSEEPKLLRKGLIVPEEVDKLFGIFYDKLNPSVNLLDPVLHTPESTFARCPLLFTVVCAVASRYYVERPELYSIAMHFAMTSAASSLMESKKSVELCQAYLLLSVWPLPSRKYDEDRAWLYLGLAIRMAMDLNLHLPTNVDVESEQQEREILNRTRTWIICFNMDRSSSAQLGKPMTIRENYMIRTSHDWYKRSKYNLPYDLHLCQLTALMRIMSRFQETVYADVNSTSGVKEDLDLRQTAFEFDNEIVQWEKGTVSLFASESNPNDSGSQYRCHLLPFYVNYSRLVILSFGFQYSFRMGLLSSNDDLVLRCLDSAQNVINKMVDDIAARPYLRYAPDGHLVFASFASAFLLKLLRPKFVHLLTPESRYAIVPLVERLIRVLNDPSVAIDDSHTPRIYARFLASLLQKHRAQATAQRQEHDAAQMQEGQVMGMTIDMNMVHQHNNVIPGPLSPPSPHPSIQVTPPPADLSFSFLLHDPNAEERDSAEGGEFDLPPTAPSGSGTVHPMDEIARGEEDEDLLQPLKAINDPGPFWGHGMVPWPEVGIPAGHWDKSFSHHPFLTNIDA